MLPLPFIVCGQLADSSVIPERLAPVVEAGIMPAKLAPDWEIPARGLYFEHPQRQRDEGVRSGAIGKSSARLKHDRAPMPSPSALPLTPLALKFRTPSICLPARDATVSHRGVPGR
jgi:hypothetical protein